MEERGPDKERKGLYIVTEGIDGAGKGTLLRALIQYEQRLGRNTFDSISFSKAEQKGLPELEDFWNPPIRHYHTIITAEPTYAGIGKILRDEITNKKNVGKYSPQAETEAYSLDRLVQLRRVTIPALENGVRVLQERCCASTLAYQVVRARDEGVDEEEFKRKILEQEGNKLQLQWRPDLLIISTITDVREGEKRLKERADFDKEDLSRFENLGFQQKIDAVYKSDWLRKIFEDSGTVVKYLNTSKKTPDKSRKEVVKIYEEFLKERNQHSMIERRKLTY